MSIISLLAIFEWINIRKVTVFFYHIQTTFDLNNFLIYTLYFVIVHITKSPGWIDDVDISWWDNNQFDGAWVRRFE